MTRIKQSGPPLLIVALIGAIAGYLIRGNGSQLTQDAIAAQRQSAAQSNAGQVPKPSPVKPVANRDVYYPGTEELKPDEVRVICLGSGMWNVTQEGVRTRMAVANPESYPTPALSEKQVAAGGERYQTPDSVLDGWPDALNELTEKIYADFNKKHGTDFKFQLKK